MSRKSQKTSGRPKPRGQAHSPAREWEWWLRPRRLAIGVSLLLCLGIGLAFGRAVGFGFVDYDDPGNVSENPIVRQGLTAGGFLWAFTHVQIGSWVPLTTLSHMLDCQIHGMWAGGHHLTSVLLHGAASLMLFMALRGMTGSLWRSAFVAALFAFHPLRTESVAWISERKDVLSGLFFMLILAAYSRWVREPSRGRIWVFLFLALGLLSKAMLVTVPLVLLLLDHWPLRRTGKVPLPRLVVEKLPLLALSVAATIAQLVASRQNFIDIDAAPFGVRVANAIVSCAAYVVQMFWPGGLAAAYPFPANGVGWLPLLGSLMLLAAISVAAYRWRRQAPWLAVGWLWYLAMVFPVLGLVQAGEVARADRYTYLPHIGLYLALVWTIGAWAARHHSRRVLVGVSGFAVLIALSIITFRQVGFWKDSETLWRRALACNANNDTAHYNLGTRRLAEGKLDEAISHYEKTLAANPRYADAHINLGRARLQQGKPAGAVAHYRQALAIKPRYAEAHFNLGIVLAQEQRLDEAVAHYKTAIEIRPEYFDARNNLGSALLQSGRPDDAIAHYQEALRIEPGNAKAQNNLATALAQKGRIAEAIALYEDVLKADPNHAKALNSLAWLLATSADAATRDTARAVTLAERASQLMKESDPVMLRTLAAAYAGAGRFESAVQAAQRALSLATTQKNDSLTGRLRSDLELYTARKPLIFPQQK